MTMFFKKCKFKQALEADRYVRGLLTEAQEKAYEQKLSKSAKLRKEVRFAKQLMLFYQKPIRAAPK